MIARLWLSRNSCLSTDPPVGRALSVVLTVVILAAACGVYGPDRARYENAEYGLRFDYPLGWIMVAEEANLDTMGDLWVCMVPLGALNTSTRPILDLIVTPGAERDISPSGQLSYAEERVEERVTGSFMVLSSEEARVAGLPGRETAILYQFAVGPGEEVSPLTLTEKVLFWEKDGNLYELSCRAVTEDVPACDEAFDLVKRTFAFQ